MVAAHVAAIAAAGSDAPVEKSTALPCLLVCVPLLRAPDGKSARTAYHVERANVGRFPRFFDAQTAHNALHLCDQKRMDGADVGAQSVGRRPFLRKIDTFSQVLTTYAWTTSAAAQPRPTPYTLQLSLV